LTLLSVIRPLGPVSGVMRIFVQTGGVHNPGLEKVKTEVDLILKGMYSLILYNLIF